jgi:hypothetical protein
MNIKSASSSSSGSKRLKLTDDEIMTVSATSFEHQTSDHCSEEEAIQFIRKDSSTSDKAISSASFTNEKRDR